MIFALFLQLGKKIKNLHSSETASSSTEVLGTLTVQDDADEINSIPLEQAMPNLYTPQSKKKKTSGTFVTPTSVRSTAASSTCVTSSTSSTPATSSSVVAGSVSQDKFLQLLTSCALDSDLLKKKLDEMITENPERPDSERIYWGRYYTAICTRIPEDKWHTFCDRTYQLICDMRSPSSSGSSTTNSAFRPVTRTTPSTQFRAPQAPSPRNFMSGDQLRGGMQSYQHDSNYGSYQQYGQYSMYDIQTPGFSPQQPSQGNMNNATSTSGQVNQSGVGYCCDLNTPTNPGSADSSVLTSALNTLMGSEGMSTINTGDLNRDALSN